MGNYQIIKLAEGLCDEPVKDWPYFVDYDTRGSERPFVLSEGRYQGCSGGEFTAQEILARSDLIEHLSRAKADWLIPTLKRIANGEILNTNDIIAAYIAHHKKEPVIEIMPG